MMYCVLHHIVPRKVLSNCTMVSHLCLGDRFKQGEANKWSSGAGGGRAG